MDMEQTVRMAMREGLGLLKDRQAKGIMEVADEVAKREKQELMRHLAARKFGPAASALISLLKRVLSPRFALKLLRKGLVGAASVTIKSHDNVGGPARAHEHEAGRAAARIVQGRGARARPRARPAAGVRRPPSVPGAGPRHPLSRARSPATSSTSCAAPTTSISRRSAAPGPTTRSGRRSPRCSPGARPCRR